MEPAHAVGLGGLELRTTVDHGQRCGDADGATVERDIAPPQSEQLTASHAGAERCRPQVGMLVVASQVEEVSYLGGGPHG